jgi:hypothetical protein
MPEANMYSLSLDQILSSGSASFQSQLLITSHEGSSRGTSIKELNLRNQELVCYWGLGLRVWSVTVPQRSRAVFSLHVLIFTGDDGGPLVAIVYIGGVPWMHRCNSQTVRACPEVGEYSGGLTQQPTESQSSVTALSPINTCTAAFYPRILTSLRWKRTGSAIQPGIVVSTMPGWIAFARTWPWPPSLVNQEDRWLQVTALHLSEW